MDAMLLVLILLLDGMPLGNTGCQSRSLFIPGLRARGLSGLPIVRFHHTLVRRAEYDATSRGLGRHAVSLGGRRLSRPSTPGWGGERVIDDVGACIGRQRDGEPAMRRLQRQPARRGGATNVFK